MVQVTDIRQTRVFQEALEEGVEKGREEVARRLLAKEFQVNQVVELTGLSLAQVKRLKKVLSNGPSK